MNQFDQNINKDMIDSDLIDVESIDSSDNQTWLYKIPEDSGQKVDLVEFNLACDWPVNEDEEYLKLEKDLNNKLDNILKNQVVLPDKHKFDSRTYVKPKKRMQRPSIQSIVEVGSNPASMSPHTSLNPLPNKYLTYNKYSSPLGPISPMLRLKTFNVDTNTENSHVVKDFAMKRRGVAQDDDPQLEDIEVERSTGEHAPFKAINIDLSQPAHNVHNTFNKGVMQIMQESGSMNMYRSGESLMRMSPPSLVSSMLMENSGNFNAESMDSRKSQRDSGIPMSGRDSIDPMMTSMTLSILDEKDMSTSFLSQTTYPDNDSFMDSLPPSLVNSVNSAYVLSNTSKSKTETTDTNIFSSATFTHLDQTEKLLSARPRCQLYNNITRRDSIRNSESYTKAKEEACQIDTTKILNENSDINTVPQQKNSSKTQNRPNGEMSETITLHYSNNRFRRDNDAEKENLNGSFQCDDAFYKDMGVPKPHAVDLGKNSMNVTLDKQELNEIIQARQKLSLARKALPSEPATIPVDTSVKTIQLPNQTVITVPKQSMENASELLSRRRAMNNYEKPEDHVRDAPKRNATFKKQSPTLPKTINNAMDATVVFVKTDENNIIDINSATMNLIDSSERNAIQEDWGLQERAMVGSSESTGTDTGTFSSSSPPGSVPDTADTSNQVASTPLIKLKKGSKKEFLDIHSTISPIYDAVPDNKPNTVTNNSADMAKTYDLSPSAINSATLVKKSAKRDILVPRSSPEKKISCISQMQRPTAVSRISSVDTATYSVMPTPSIVPRNTGLPKSKLRQYSSHKELNRIPGNPPSTAARVLAGRTMVRRGVYASNPALSPTAPVPPVHSALVLPQRRESYTVAVHQRETEPEKQERPTLVNPPALVRQGTETLRRERPQSQLVAPKDLRLSAVGPSGVPVSLRNHYIPPPTTRPYTIAGASQLRVSRPNSVPLQKSATVPAPQVEQPRPATGVERTSALPRPSRLPGPRRSVRPPSVYTVAPTATADSDQY